MIKVKQFIFGVWYVFKAMIPMISRWYEEGTAMLAVIQAELEGMSATGDFSKLYPALRKVAKKKVAVKAIKESFLSPLKKQSDEVISTVIELAVGKLFGG